MPLTVLHVGYPLAPVSPDTAGGAEQILGVLDASLVEAGHHSFVVAPAGSTCHGTLLATMPLPSWFDDASHALACEEHRMVIQKTLSTIPIDVVHMHGIDFDRYLPLTSVPVLITLHLPPSWYPCRVFRRPSQNLHLVCVSKSQASSCPAGSEIEAVIENGIPLPQYIDTIKKDYVVALGRICPEKGLHLALDAATTAGLPLVLAGKVFEYATHQQYWHQEIKPRLKSPHRFVGSVGPEKKQELLAHARCLVVSSLVEETSCLVAMEAMACGTPVVALRRGALPEIIDHGHTGFLVESPEQLPDAILATRQLSPHVCRQHAEARFSSRRMSARYLRLYRDLSHARVRRSESGAERIA